MKTWICTDCEKQGSTCKLKTGQGGEPPVCPFMYARASWIEITNNQGEK